MINRAGLVGGMVFFIETLNGRDEAGGNSVFLIEIDGTLNGLVSEHVTVGKVFSNDAASWLLLLGNLIGVTLRVLCEMAAIIVGASGGRCDLDFGGTQLCVI